MPPIATLPVLDGSADTDTQAHVALDASATAVPGRDCATSVREGGGLVAGRRHVHSAVHVQWCAAIRNGNDARGLDLQHPGVVGLSDRTFTPSNPAITVCTAGRAPPSAACDGSVFTSTLPITAVPEGS